jgi:predicted Zn-dependent protease
MRRQKWFDWLRYGLLAVGLVVISEVVFTVTHREEKEWWVINWEKAKAAYAAGKNETGFSLLQSAYEARWEWGQRYEAMGPVDGEQMADWEPYRPEIDQAMSRELSGQGQVPEAWGQDYIMARVLYEAALALVGENKAVLAEDLLKSAVRTKPNHSYFYLELAAYLRDEGRSAEAEQVLADCLDDNEAKQHCQDLQTSFWANSQFYPLGFLRLWIEGER